MLRGSVTSYVFGPRIAESVQLMKGLLQTTGPTQTTQLPSHRPYIPRNKDHKPLRSQDLIKRHGPKKLQDLSRGRKDHNNTRILHHLVHKAQDKGGIPETMEFAGSFDVYVFLKKR